MSTRTVVPPNAELALEHIHAAQNALGHDNVGPQRDDDPRYGLLCQCEFNWDAGDRRWDAAKALISHDQRDELASETLGLLVKICDLANERLADLESTERSDEDAVRREARELRDATDRLSDIVRAITALPLVSGGH